MSEALVAISRGPLVENIIRGDIVVVGADGKVSASVGDPHKVTFMRSAAKPLQTSAGIECGAIDAFSIPEEGIAVMCGSHIGDDTHVRVIEDILQRLGLSEDDFTLGPALSMSHRLEQERLLQGVPPRKIYNNCSGKHSCMLAMCRYLALNYSAYQVISHPVQQLILNTVAEYAEMRPKEIILGVDGCGVPVFAMPLVQMAVAYLNLCNPKVRLQGTRSLAAQRIITAMGHYPEMVAGKGQFCTELIQTTKGRIIGKLGADGIYCCAPVDGNCAISLKIEDGNMQALSIVMMSVLRQLDLLTEEEWHALEKFASRDNYNCQQDKVGKWYADFSLSARG